MMHSLLRSGALALAVLPAALAVPALAQERGEEVVGKIISADGRRFVLRQDDGREVAFRVTPSTEVYFQDSGDRKLFPNPTIADLRTGMGARFVYGDGTPSRVVVVYVPAGHVRETAPEIQRETVRARVESVDRAGRELTVRVDGRVRTYPLEDRRDLRRIRAGDTVDLTLENRAQGEVVTRVERVSADLLGTVRSVDRSGGTVVIFVEGQDETYSVDNGKLLDAIEKGDRVRFQVEDRGSRRVIVDMQRRKY
ncbi:MAG TPA: copper-binding protein [Vicinamibacteria bacterium]|nr:copper-binding protein [Vicinamibacteria bacterium]